MKSFKNFFESIEITKQTVKRIYDNFNQKYFNNALPRDIKIKISKSKSFLGKAEALYNKTTGEIKIKGLKISTFYDLEEVDLMGIIMHEMVHLEQYTLGNVYDIGKGGRGGHGIRFKARVNELQKIVDFQISDDGQETRNIKPNKASKSLMDVILIHKTKRNAYTVATFKKGFISKNLADIQKRMDYYAKGTEWKIFLIQSDSHIIQEFTATRKLSRATFYILKNELAEELLKNGKVIFKIDAKFI